MRELRLVLEAADRLADRNTEGVLATVVQTEGSTYRRPGARLLVAGDGAWVGGISGGCLEGGLARKAWWLTDDGPALVTFDSTADDETAWQFGVGCNGVVRVLLERLTPGRADPLDLVRRCVWSGRPGVLATVFRADPGTGVAVGEQLLATPDGGCETDLEADELIERIRADAADCLDEDRSRTVTYDLPAGEAEVFLEVVRPPLHLVVFGAGFDAVPVVNAGKALGWQVTVVDRRLGFARQAAFAAADEALAVRPEVLADRLDRRTAAVVMHHNFPDDRAAVATLLNSDVPYIGVLGPRARTEKILAELELSADTLARLYAPVGLDIGAETPEEIAAAVVAQVIAVFAGHDGGHLRDRRGPIHRRDPARVPEPVS
jgi:xanthine dehydrogenase accessory factor